MSKNAWIERVLSLPCSFLSFTLTPDGFSLSEGIAALTDSIWVEMRSDSIALFDLQSCRLLWTGKEQQNEIQPNQILNLSDEGDRWEGDVLREKPYGWGVLYDADNNKVYEGFRMGDVNSCYGRCFYSDIGKKEYEGQMCNGKRWGRGTQYDRNEKTVFDGEWMDDDRLQSSVVFSTASQLLHNRIEELTFSANCCNEPGLKEVSFRCFTHLRSLIIRDNSFKHPKRVVFQHMNCLESITVGRNCFKETQTGFDKLERAFICSDNPSLKSIHVGCFSFPEFSQCVIHSTHTPPPSRIDLPRLEEIRFGEGSDHALCFYWSDCVLRDLPSLRSVSLGPYCFYSSRHTVFESASILFSLILRPSSSRLHSIGTLCPSQREPPFLRPYPAQYGLFLLLN